ncbi:YkuS family protein [Bacillus salacetis]|uniref:YkuS family protein n=1 Tax=Bacillus salacetis TaxID=2315464 RepID=UPI003BA37F23
MAKIAVEEPLTDIKQALEEKGHTVEIFRDEENLPSCDCCVTRGSEDLADNDINVPVVDVTGRSVNDVVSKVESKLQASE